MNTDVKVCCILMMAIFCGMIFYLLMISGRRDDWRFDPVGTILFSIIVAGLVSVLITVSYLGSLTL